MSIVFNADLVSVWDLFHGKSYVVPVFQRDYAWEKEQIQEFWTDISGFENSEIQEHFLGSIILTQLEGTTSLKSNFEVIDGQQRITTIQIFLASIRDQWLLRGNPQKTDQGILVARQDLTAILVHTTIPNVRFILTPNRHLKQIFKDFVQVPVLNNQKDINDKFALRTYEGFDHAADLIRAIKQVRSMVSSLSDDQLAKLEDFLLYHVKILRVEAGGAANAFLLFETLNYRGMELAQTDLVKSYLYSKVLESKQEQFIKDWDDTVAMLGKTSPDTFLRHVLTLTHGTIQKKNIFSTIKDLAYDSDSAINLGMDLKVSAGLYSFISRESDVEGNLANEINAHLDRLSELKVDTQSIFILAVLEKFYSTNQIDGRKKILDYLWITEVLSFRWSTCGKNAQDLENLYQSAANALLSSNSEVEAELASRLILIDAMPNDVIFEENLSTSLIKQSGRAHYILRSIEEQWRNDPIYVLTDPKKLHVEHIAPQRPSQNDQTWKNALDGDLGYYECVYLIGNQMLLPGKKNKEASNKNFQEKLRIYNQVENLSDSVVKNLWPKWTRDVMQKSEWTQHEIVDRTTRIAKKALEVWKIPS